MAHKTLIGGKSYDTKGGKTLIDGKSYSISCGKTRINDITYDISFTKICTITIVGISATWGQTVTINEVSYEPRDSATLEVESGTVITATIGTMPGYVKVNGVAVTSYGSNVSYNYTVNGPISITFTSVSYDANILITEL